jgi:hypothetical protein
MVIDGNNTKVFDPAGKQLSADSKGFGSHDPHLRNFLACIRSGERPVADIEEGHKSTLLCQLGNIAYRTGTTLNLDAKSGQLQDNPAAAALWSREYRPGWEPKV